MLIPSTIPDNRRTCFNSNFDPSFRHYAGRYQRDDFNIVYVFFNNGELTLRPMFWTSTQHLKEAKKDSFLSKGHENLSFLFQRKGEEITAVELIGFRDEKGLYKKLGLEITPVEDIFAGKSKVALRKLMVAHKTDTLEFTRIGQRLAERFTTKKEIARNYLLELVKYYPRHAPFYSLLGDVLVYMGERNEAIKHYQQAFRLDSNNRSARIALKELNVIPWTQQEESSKWKLPFELRELFANPSTEEINSTKKEWAARDLSVKDLKRISEQDMIIGNTAVKLHIISHTVHGFRHYGAIIVPWSADTKKFPAIIELKGVSPGYNPLNIGDNLESTGFLCNEFNQFIYILPSYRGEKMIVNAREYLSEGDRTDSWDGATDDALALLNAAVTILPQIDQEKVGVFGRSRGGSVALLAGIRDSRIKQVVSLSGPTDWFRNMGQSGWEQQELVDIGLHIRASTFDIGGQFIERILKKVIDGKDGLIAARKRMISSSPLYFLQYLKNTQVHFGIEDRVVQVINGTSLLKKIEDEKLSLPEFQYFFHATEGHDTDKDIYYPAARKAFLSLLK